ncbi:MAG: aldo/keto reductase [Armatimonadetes bacterium]|nr:aldo/keto reductase [Armatimonadota bacterium]
MQTRLLGRTGLNVSVLSLGASPLGSVFRNIDESEGIRTVHEAIDLGINFIDVSPYYGETQAETVLGKALKGFPRDSYILATKVGRYGPDRFDFSAERVTRSVDESLERLRVDVIDVIQCHDIEFGSPNQVIEETIPALRRVREQGKARFIGITGLPLKIFREVLSRTEVDTILSYCRYSLNDASLESIIPFLKEKGVGIISASPLSMGLLTERGAPVWHPAPDALKAAARKAAEHCRERGEDLSRLALQFAVANPDIATTLVGTASLENLKKNVEWAQSPPDPELLNEVREIFRPVQNLTWPSGRPENNDEARLV